MNLACRFFERRRSYRLVSGIAFIALLFGSCSRSANTPPAPSIVADDMVAVEIHRLNTLQWTVAANPPAAELSDLAKRARGDVDKDELVDVVWNLAMSGHRELALEVVDQVLAMRFSKPGSSIAKVKDRIARKYSSGEWPVKDKAAMDKIDASQQIGYLDDE